jgi:hypothetical protein
MVNIENMRSILEEKGLTIYNNFAPLLIKKFAGITPPLLSYSNRRKMKDYYRLISKHYDLLKEDCNLENGPYVPYFLFKIIEILFHPKSPEYKLIYWIHVQMDNTLVKKDLIFKEICNLEPKLNGKYTPTIRVLF